MKRIHADELAVGMVVLDEYAPVVFVVTAVNVAENSTQVTGTRIGYHALSDGTGGATLTEYSTMFINEDSGIWDLTN